MHIPIYMYVCIYLHTSAPSQCSAVFCPRGGHIYKLVYMHVCTYIYIHIYILYICMCVCI